jgi:hypothetical protein
MGGIPLNAPIVGIAATPDHGRYWLAATDGGIYAFGDAAFYGSVPRGSAARGGVFLFGDAMFPGSIGGIHLNKPVVGMAWNTMGAINSWPAPTAAHLHWATHSAGLGDIAS